MPKFRINSPAPGTVIEGIGVVPPGTEIDLPLKSIVRRYRDNKPIRVRVSLKPRASWEPLDDAAKDLVKAHLESLDDSTRNEYMRQHEHHKKKTGASDDEEVLEDETANGGADEEVDEDETVDEPSGAKKSKKQKRASDAP